MPPDPTPRPGRPRTRTPSGPAAAIGAAIEARRLALGWTREQLAEVSGVKLRVLGDYERGTSPEPSVVKLAAIAEALGCTVDDLLGR